MSALFDSDTGVFMDHVVLPRNLEPRRVPRLYEDQTRTPLKVLRDGFRFSKVGNHALRAILMSAYLQPETNWMYTAMIQTILDGPEPSWSKDGWSFAPIDLTELQNNLIFKRRHLKSPNQLAPNITVNTPAIRGRIECTVIEEAKDTSLWLTTINQDNITSIAKSWNSTMETVLDTRIGTLDPTIAPFLGIIGNETYHVPTMTMFNATVRTRFTAKGLDLRCCANISDAAKSYKQSEPVVLAYWTENWERRKPPPITSDLFRADSPRPTGNFTVKWIRGPAGFAPSSNYSSGGNLYFTEVPAIQAMNCVPIIETSEAEVMINSHNGNVQTYRILQEPVSEDAAWTDACVYRNDSALLPASWPIEDDEGRYQLNVTAR